MNYLGIPETRSKQLKMRLQQRGKPWASFLLMEGSVVSSLVHSVYQEELLDNLGTRKNHMRPMYGLVKRTFKSNNSL